MKKEPTKKVQVKKSPGKPYQVPPKQEFKNRYADVAGMALIILLGLIIYSNSFQCSFHFDDLSFIVHNPKIYKLSDINSWWSIYPSRPLSIFTFALNYHYNQLDVWYYHLVNLVIHLFNACMVWWLTMLILSTPAMKDHTIARQKNIIALFTALLFVSHPLATQSVTYIWQRQASLVTLFYLLSMAIYVKARIADKSSVKSYMLFTGSLISAVLAMLTKENAFTLPFAILLLELFFLQTKKRLINIKNYRIILSIAAFLGLIFIIILTFQSRMFKPIPPSSGNSETITPLNYLFTQFSVIARYIRLLFLPIGQNFDYDYPVSNNFFEMRTMFSFLGLLSLIVLAIFLFKRSRIISFGIIFFFLTLSVESGFIPINDVIFEHRTYLPSIGFFLVLASSIYVLLWNKYKYLAIAVLVIIIGSNSILTYGRNKVWKDDLSLWNDVALKSPHKARPFVNRGYAYRNLDQRDNEIADYTTAIRIDPKFTIAWYCRGVAFGSLGQWDKAIADYSKAIEIDSGYSDALISRGIAFGSRRQWDKAIADYSMAVKINPNNAQAYSNRGIAYNNLGQLNNAVADYSRAIGIEPNYMDAYMDRGVAYGGLGQLDKAIADFSKAIQIDPKFAKAWYSRGVAYGILKQWDNAIADYTRAIEIDPKYTRACYNRGAAYANLGQWANAITDYTRAIGIDPGYAKAFYNRGVAYDNLGQFDNAIADYTKAIVIDPTFTMAYSSRELSYRKSGSHKKNEW